MNPWLRAQQILGIYVSHFVNVLTEAADSILKEMNDSLNWVLGHFCTGKSWFKERPKY